MLKIVSDLRVSFKLYKKRDSARKFCDIFKNTFFTEHIWATVSEEYFKNKAQA